MENNNPLVNQQQINQQQIPLEQQPDIDIPEKKPNKLLKIVIIVIILLFLVAGGAFGFWIYQEKIVKKPVPYDYTLKNSEGNCIKDADCAWAGKGCGGGHGVCTNNPGKYVGAVSTCDIVPDFPANEGYTCSCILSLNKCGWKK